MKKNNKLLDTILKRAEEERFNLKHPYVGSEHLFLSILKTNNPLSSYLKDYKVTYNLFKKELVDIVGKSTKDFNVNLYTPLLRKIIKRSENNYNVDECIENNLFLSMLDEGEGIAIRILLKMNVDLDEIYLDLKEKRKLSLMEESNKIGILLNDVVNNDEKVIGRDNEIDKIILSLSRKKKCNPLLIGPAGVGKTAIIEELTRRINKHQIPKYLDGYKVFMIEMGSLIAGTKYRGEFEERLNKILKEMINNKKTIIFIDEIHTMVGAGGAEGAINASDILKPYLARGDIKCIGATTPLEYSNTILKDKALARRFDVINILEPNKEDMKYLLKKIKKEYELFHDIKIPSNLLNKIIDLSNCYMKKISNPDKSIDLLDSSCALAKINNHDTLMEEDIINTIFYKTNNIFVKKDIFINKLKNKLTNIFIKKDINNITNVFEKHDSLPISIISNNNYFLDVLKNEICKINIIDIDFKLFNYSYNNTLYIDKKIEDSIFNTMIENPFSIIVINNIKEAPFNIINELKKINTDGVITFKNNEKLYFNNTIIYVIDDSLEDNKTGFNISKKSFKFDDEFIKSFKLDLRNIHINSL